MTRRVAQLAALIVGASTLVAASCDPTPPPENPERVKLSDLRSRVSPLPEDPELSHAQAMPAQALITRLNIPREVSINRPWKAVSSAGLDPAALELWRLNGLRAGTIEVAKAGAFVGSMPDALEGRSQTLIRAPHPSGIAVNEALDRPRRVVLALAPGDRQAGEVDAGRFQLLVTLRDAGDGRVTVEVSPHRYFPRKTIEVRTPMERESDGQVFKALSLTTTLPTDRLLVIAFEPDTPAFEEEPAETQPPEPDEAKSPVPEDAPPPDKASSDGHAKPRGESRPTATAPAATQPATQPTTRPAATRPAPPATLGEMILTTTRQNTPVHVVLLVGVQAAQKYAADEAKTRPAR